ncbi:DUF2269 family protein [Paraburkholderia fynbosensis]|uniref:DUF2269 domain-containing protein n=1 Tax=Paraburkholderia fynbosensis TaxID=1200993 RepID=A0A6J5GLM0_9BURK|nr:DUF2269 domain-containing protein [Paraburkholderia fynbosensis]CAB3803100.1 hypothetical protein LMG27177_05388 [Paraburkholderia fynbosensis]
MTYLLVKWLHVLSSTILFGTGIGSAFYMLTVSLGKETHTVARVTRRVVVADWLFTTPTAIAQPLTGFAMVKLAGMSIASPWLAWSIALYAVAIACWLPVVCLQIRLAAIARRCDEMRAPLTAGYWRLFAWWIGLGVVAFFAFVAIFWFMVAKTV